MKESAQLALSWLSSRSVEVCIFTLFSKQDLQLFSDYYHDTFTKANEDWIGPKSDKLFQIPSNQLEAMVAALLAQENGLTSNWLKTLPPFSNQQQWLGMSNQSDYEPLRLLTAVLRNVQPKRLRTQGRIQDFFTRGCTRLLPLLQHQ